MNADNQLVIDIIQRLGIAGFALFLMYKIADNHLSGLKEEINKLREEIRELKEVILRMVLKSAS